MRYFVMKIPLKYLLKRFTYVNLLVSSKCYKSSQQIPFAKVLHSSDEKESLLTEKYTLSIKNVNFLV